MALRKPEGNGRVALSGAKILQLIPANPGWWMRYRDNTPGGEWTAPVVAWAPETEEGWQHIYGVDPISRRLPPLRRPHHRDRVLLQPRTTRRPC